MKHSYRDAVTNVLVAQGFVTRTQAGEIERDEPDDFNLAPGLWQWNGSAWVSYTPPATPDGAGFELALHEAFPDQTFLTFISVFPASWLFLDSIRRGVWPQVQALIQLALQQNAITQQQYDTIKATAATYHIPITL